MSAATLEMHEIQLRGFASAVLDQARRDIGTAMKRARVVLKRRKAGLPLGREHVQLQRHHVEAAAWFFNRGAEKMGFWYVCDVLGFDVESVRRRCTRGFDKQLLREALVAQCGSPEAVMRWLDGGSL